jgi:hypothetical protein
VEIRGSFEAPDPCQTVTGTLDRDGEDLVARISVRSTGEPCIQMIATFVYEGVIRDLSPGSYRVRVLLEYPGTGWDARTAVDTRVTVR